MAQYLKWSFFLPEMSLFSESLKRATMQIEPETHFLRPRLVLLFVSAYVFLDWVSYIHPVYPFAITPWMPASGLGLAFLLKSGLRQAPTLFVAALVAEIAVRGMLLPPIYAVLSSAILAVGYTGAAALLLGPMRFDARLRSLRDLSRLLGVTFVTGLMTGGAYVALYAFAGLIPWGAEFLPDVLEFLRGYLVGVLVVTPLILVHAPTGALLRSVRWPRGDIVLAQGASVLMVLWIIFGLNSPIDLQFVYLLFLPLVWIAMGYGIKGATIANCAIQLGLILAVQWLELKSDVYIAIQFLMLVLAIAGLFLGIEVSERRRVNDALQEKDAELSRTMQMAAAGEMASAVAHELNQPLSAISNYLRACQLMLSAPDADTKKVNETMNKVVLEARRAGHIIRRLRDFYRDGVSLSAPVSVESLVRGITQTALKRVDRHQIALNVHCMTNLPVVVVDRVHIEIVLNNLIYNAIDAIVSSNTRIRRIEIRAESDGSGKVQVGVIDSGPGLRPDIAKRLFEPFSTSKQKGMGLGLAISRSIIEAHGGKLWFEQPAGGGTAFYFTLSVQDPQQRDKNDA